MKHKPRIPRFGWTAACTSLQGREAGWLTAFILALLTAALIRRFL